MNKTVHRIVRITLALLCMAMIFYLSHQKSEVSSMQSRNVTQRILEESGKKYLKVQNPYAFVHAHRMVRKAAHMGEYALLGYLVYSAMLSLIQQGRYVYVYSFMVSLLFAVSDEIHQIFVPGRSGQASDVLIDGVGIVLGMCLYKMIKRVKIKSH